MAEMEPTLLEQLDYFASPIYYSPIARVRTAYSGYNIPSFTVLPAERFPNWLSNSDRLTSACSLRADS